LTKRRSGRDWSRLQVVCFYKQRGEEKGTLYTKWGDYTN
jgi:hypothetical protein